MNRLLRFCTLALAALALAGCASSVFPAFNPAGRNLGGQVLYVSKKRTFVGEFTVRQSATDFALDVTKGPGMELILIRQNGGNLARVEAMNHSWQGDPQRFTPPQVRNWLALREVFAGQNPPDATVSRSPGRIAVEFKNGERFVFHINP